MPIPTLLDKGKPHTVFIRKTNLRFPMNYDGNPLHLSDLPPKHTLDTRWTSVKKASVLLAVEQGIISFPEAESWYNLSIEEYLEWRSEYKVGGLEQLKEKRD